MQKIQVAKSHLAVQSVTYITQINTLKWVAECLMHCFEIILSFLHSSLLLIKSYKYWFLQVVS